MANIKKITLPTGTTYDIVDQGARDLIDALSGYTSFLGVTTTPLTDGATTNPITISGQPILATTGAITAYGSAEFIWNGSAWQEFGDLGALGALAYKDSASTTYTPTGNVTQPTFSGTAGTISMDYTPSGTLNAPKFTGSQATITAAYTPSGTIAMGTGTGTANYTPAGNVTQPTFSGTEATITAAFTPAGTITMGTETGTANYTPSGSVTLTAPTVVLSTSNIRPVSSVGALPSAVMPVLTTTVENETLTLGWTAGTWDAGALPTLAASIPVATGVSSVTAGTGTFNGNGVRLKGTFAGTSGNATATYTPAGTVTKPTFSGTGVQLTAAFTGTAGNATATYTPSGTVAAPTFTGSSATLSTSYTPSGTVTKPNFNGTQAIITVS